MGGGRGRKSPDKPKAEQNIKVLNRDIPKAIPSWLKSLIVKAYEKGKQDGAMEIVDQMKHLESISLEEILA